VRTGINHVLAGVSLESHHYGEMFVCNNVEAETKNSLKVKSRVESTSTRLVINIYMFAVLLHLFSQDSKQGLF
jgi:hypothetical protein